MCLLCPANPRAQRSSNGSSQVSRPILITALMRMPFFGRTPLQFEQAACSYLVGNFTNSVRHSLRIPGHLHPGGWALQKSTVLHESAPNICDFMLIFVIGPLCGAAVWSCSEPESRLWRVVASSESSCLCRCAMRISIRYRKCTKYFINYKVFCAIHWLSW